MWYRLEDNEYNHSLMIIDKNDNAADDDDVGVMMMVMMV